MTWEAVNSKKNTYNGIPNFTRYRSPFLLSRIGRFETFSRYAWVHFRLFNLFYFRPCSVGCPFWSQLISLHQETFDQFSFCLCSCFINEFVSCKSTKCERLSNDTKKVSTREISLWKSPNLNERFRMRFA